MSSKTRISMKKIRQYKKKFLKKCKKCKLRNFLNCDRRNYKMFMQFILNNLEFNKNLYEFSSAFSSASLYSVYIYIK